MRKNTLLIAVAAAALAVGSGTAFAQGAPEAGHKADSPAAQANPALKNAPAEKIQGAEHRGSKSETTGQGASERGQKMGQDNKGLNKSNKSTTGQAPSEPKSGQANEREPKSGQANERQNQKMGQDQKNQDQKNLNNKNTTGQAPSQQTTPRSDRMNNANERTNEPNRAGQTNERNERGANENRTGTSTSTSASVNLSSEQRTKIHSIIVSDRSAPRVAHVDFEVRPGIVVPRDRVKLVPLPSTIVEIEPSWRGFEYFLVGDEIVVVDPATLRIVAVLPA